VVWVTYNLPMKPMRLPQTLLFVGSLGLCIQWLGLSLLHTTLTPGMQALLSGIAVFGAAFLLSWAAELSQLEIPEALALAFVALVAVLPEYAVDMYFAWKAGKDPMYVSYAAANMTGGNRLLIGAGWGAVVIAYWLKTRKKSISLDRGQRLELLALLAATIYSFVIPFKKNLSLVDSAFFLALFAVYMTGAARSEHQETEMEEGPAEWLSQFPRGPRLGITIGLFGLAAWTIFQAAQPFAEGLLHVGRHWGIEEFILVQWLAPLASESPEFIVAILFALRNRPSAGIGALVSSKVNQWTLLIGMLPIAYAISAHSTHAMQLDARQVEEMFLTSAQSFFAIILICDLEFSLADGLWLLVLFVVPFLSSSTYIRTGSGVVYLILAALFLMGRSTTRKGLADTFRQGLSRFKS
jgi:cation:H+ antiporter